MSKSASLRNKLSPGPEKNYKTYNNFPNFKHKLACHYWDWERADLLALVCGVYCEFVTFPLVSWVRCGTRLYRFLIFAPLLT